MAQLPTNAKLSHAMPDSFIDNLYCARTAQSQATGVVLEAFSGSTAGDRAAMICAQGDVVRAGVCGGEHWQQLAEGKLAAVLQATRGAKSAAERYLEAETLIAAGSIMPGLARMNNLHRTGYPPATLGLARRLHMLADHRSAERIAATMPYHAHTAMIGARAALSAKRYEQTGQFLHLLLNGTAPVPESSVAGGLAIITAAWLLETGEHQRLQSFARRLLQCADLPEDMLSAVARVAWIAGYGKEAWQRFSERQEAWFAAACLELAVLAGNHTLAHSMQAKAGRLAAAAGPSLALLKGRLLAEAKEAEKLFTKGTRIHIWRTHAHCWQPWIDSALETPAEVSVFDLASKQTPATKAIPHTVLDDGALLSFLPPIPVQPRAIQGKGIWVEPGICQAVSLGFLWSPEYTDKIYQGIGKAARKERAALWVLDSDQAFPHLAQGKPMIVLARPGDPFWAGPLPAKVWPQLRLIRADAQTAWQDAPTQVIAAAQELLGQQPTASTA